MQNCIVPDCGRELTNDTYGQRCEDCWASQQACPDRPNGIPYLSGLGERRPIKASCYSDDLVSLFAGGLAVA